jgi:phage major head subunit gpT-like protein
MAIIDEVIHMANWMNLQLFATSVPVQPVVGTNATGYAAGDLGANGATTNFGKLLEPGLRKIFFEVYDEEAEQYSRIYNVMDSLKARETDWGMGAFGDWTKRTTQIDTVDYKTLASGLQRTYTHDAFTQGFMITREMYDDDQYRQIEKFPKAMARAGRAKVEKDALLPLLNGFATNGYDGVPLFATTHPLLNGGGKVGKNLITGKLSDANLKLAIQIMRETLDEAGNMMQVKPTKLIVPPALEDTAVRLLQSTQITGSANNDTNKFLSSKGIEIVVLEYLGTAGGGNDAYWFLQDGSRHELNFFWRKRPEFKWAEEFDNFVAKYRGYMRYSFGYSDWRGLLGSNGTTA